MMAIRRGKSGSFIRSHFNMAMWKFVTRGQPISNSNGQVVLPDPEKAPTPAAAQLMKAANDSIIKEIDDQAGSITSKRGVKRKRENNSYDASTRAKIGRYATEHGNTKAAKHFSNVLGKSVGESAVRVMKKAYIQSSKTGQTVTELKHARKGRPLLLGDLDSKVREHVAAIREAGGIVTQAIVIATARGIVGHYDRTLLSEHGGPYCIGKPWAASFLKRMGLVKRKGTKAARKVPANFQEQKAEFLGKVADRVEEHTIPKELVINFDQTGLKIVPVSNWTLAAEGSKQVPIVGIEDKREITALLGSTAAGQLIPPQLLYPGKTNQCHPKYEFPDNWDIHHTPNHWSNEASMLHYISEVIVPYVEQTREHLQLGPGQKALALFDVFAAHRCASVRDALAKANILQVFVPAGCTGELQPMDLSVNAEFKAAMKTQFTNFYADKVAACLRDGGDASSVTVDLRLSTLKPLHAMWIVSVFDVIKNRRDIVLNGWRMAGLLGAIDEPRVVSTKL
jgi:hypothetical protein